jgi:PAS domain-containing protein
VKDHQGTITGASKIARDITERKRAQELVRRQADLLDQSHDAIGKGSGSRIWFALSSPTSRASLALVSRWAAPGCV